MLYSCLSMFYRILLFAFSVKIQNGICLVSLGFYSEETKPKPKMENVYQTIIKFITLSVLPFSSYCFIELFLHMMTTPPILSILWCMYQFDCVCVVGFSFPATSVTFYVNLLYQWTIPCWFDAFIYVPIVYCIVLYTIVLAASPQA